MHFPDDANGEALQEMYNSGMDLSSPHDIDFFYVFSNERDAHAMSAAIKANNENAIISIEKLEDANWDLTCTINMVPSYKNITVMETMLNNIAQEKHGVPEGWGVMQE